MPIGDLQPAGSFGMQRLINSRRRDTVEQDLVLAGQREQRGGRPERSAKTGDRSGARRSFCPA
jgi:hypothetical protein